MPAHSLGSATISFGLVSIPIKLYTAAASAGVAFHLLHATCGTRIRQQIYCPVDHEVVERSELVKGYEVGDNQYVIMEEQDFAALPLKSLKTIDVVAIIPASAIDPRHYNKSYLVAPEDAGIKAFSLFLLAMEKVGKVGIVKLGFREREHLATIRAFNGVILLQTLFYADELRPINEVKPKLVEVSDREMEMAKTLLLTMAVDDVDMANFKDEYRDALKKVIEAKLQGQEIAAPPPAPGKVTDLMAALKASVDAAKRQRQAESAAPAENEKKARRRKAG